MSALGLSALLRSGPEMSVLEMSEARMTEVVVSRLAALETRLAAEDLKPVARERRLVARG